MWTKQNGNGLLNTHTERMIATLSLPTLLSSVFCLCFFLNIIVLLLQLVSRLCDSPFFSHVNNTHMDTYKLWCIHTFVHQFPYNLPMIVLAFPSVCLCTPVDNCLLSAMCHTRTAISRRDDLWRKMANHHELNVTFSLYCIEIEIISIFYWFFLLILAFLFS